MFPVGMQPAVACCYRGRAGSHGFEESGQPERKPMGRASAAEAAPSSQGQGSPSVLLPVPLSVAPNVLGNR